MVAQVHKEPQFAYSAKNMPPRFPSKPSHHILHKVPGAIPHNRFDYFPVDNYNSVVYGPHSSMDVVRLGPS